jgi:hypothetical protein
MLPIGFYTLCELPNSAGSALLYFVVANASINRAEQIATEGELVATTAVFPNTQQTPVRGSALRRKNGGNHVRQTLKHHHEDQPTHHPTGIPVSHQ